MRTSQQVTGQFTPLGQVMDSERLFQQLREIPRGTQPDFNSLCNIPGVV